MKLLITGGAGFVGSHVAIQLLDIGHDVTIIDNLSTGHKDAIPLGSKYFKADLLDIETLEKIISSSTWDAVLHFAAISVVGDSISHPYHYLRQNTLTSLNLIEICAKYGVKRFVFSSTAALFGNKNCIDPIKDDTNIEPGSPYGESKFFIERALSWAERIHGMHNACLRYFNAAGADSKGRLGEDHRPETHLIPLVIDTALGRHSNLKIFGNNYPTRDGTCVRDYIHVSDLADAHIRAIDKIEKSSVKYNLGNGKGFTNLEIIDSVERICGNKIPWSWGERRIGDPAILVADSSRIKKETGWDPKYKNLDSIIETAFLWRKNNPFGYKK